MFNDVTTSKLGEHPRARALRRVRKRLSALSLVLDGGLTAWLIVSGTLGKLSEFCQQALGSPWLSGLALAAILGFGYGLVGLPLRFVRGYLVEKHFDLSTQKIGAWWLDQLKGALLGAILGAIVVLGLITILVRSGAAWWWRAALAATLLGIVLVRIAPQLVLPLFFKLRRLENAEIASRFEALAAATRTPVLGVYEIDLSRRTRAANAAVIGLGSSRRAIVGDTLVREFTPDETVFVLAHELAHHRYHDLWSGIALAAAMQFLSLLVTHLALKRFGPELGLTFPLNSGDFTPAVLFWIGLVSGLVSAALSPISRFFSRFIERRADRFAAEATRAPQAGAAAFRRLGYQNLAVFRPPRWEELLLYTHPCIARRIEQLESLKPAIHTR